MPPGTHSMILGMRAYHVVNRGIPACGAGICRVVQFYWAYVYCITASYSYYGLLPVLQPLARITASYPYYSLLPRRIAYSTPLYPYLSPHVAIAERCGVASRCPARDTRHRTLHNRGATAKRQCLSTLMRVMHGRATRTWLRSRQPSRPSGAYPGRASLRHFPTK